jgi:hypothetical protein
MDEDIITYETSQGTIYGVSTAYPWPTKEIFYSVCEHIEDLLSARNNYVAIVSTMHTHLKVDNKTFDFFTCSLLDGKLSRLKDYEHDKSLDALLVNEDFLSHISYK